jgi:3-oxoacyl-[acyl-carrier protein] reductase
MNEINNERSGKPARERGRTALVTGSARGMGREIALRLAATIGTVAVHYLNSAQEAGAVVEEARARGARSEAFRADLTEEAGARDLLGRVEAELGGIDILVNNIGPFLVKPWSDLSGPDWDSMFKGVLESAYFCLQGVLPGMRARKWGRIVNIGYSRAEQLGSFPTIMPYAIAKTGLLILTRTAAVSEVGHGITINMVSPGLIEGGALPPAKNLPPAAIGRPGDVAEAVAFLASEEASAVTGANVIVAGTWKM